MATLAPQAILPRTAVGSIAPDRYEKLLAAAAVVLLVAVLVALMKGRAEWPRVPAVVWPHLLTIVVALALTRRCCCAGGVIGATACSALCGSRRCC